MPRKKVIKDTVDEKPTKKVVKKVTKKAVIKKPAKKVVKKGTSKEISSKSRSSENTPQDLLKAFLDKNNLTITGQPQFFPRDDGTYSTVVRLAVNYKPKSDNS